MPPLFTIVIPTFNRSNLFPFAVRSILKQTFQDFEIVVSDNCSGDDTPQVAAQFTDPRVRYIQTPRHYTIADNWEFARRQATGDLIMMLSDDDALVRMALERFAEEARRHDADFLFSNLAEYRDDTYPGPARNSVDSPRFSATSRIVEPDRDFIRPLFAFQPKFNMHPSAFVFPKRVADHVANRTGRFFWTNGVEYSAWPITALFAKKIVYVDLPLTVLGRTGKSWGSNIALCNPGKERIEEFIKDVDQERKHAPLNNFTMCNLMAEGMLTAKNLFKKEFEAYDFDEPNYIRKTMAELRKRQALGVDVSREIDDTLRYSAKYPSLVEEFSAAQAASQNGGVLVQRIRSTVADLGGRTLRQRLRARQLGKRLQQGPVRSKFRAFGEDFGFSDIVGCADFLAKVITNASQSSAETEFKESQAVDSHSGS